MADSSDRTVLYVLGAVGLIWFLTSKADASSTDETVTFPPNDPNVDLTPLFCAPWDTYGGWSDERKTAEGSRLYVERWGFTPPDAFLAAVAKRDPCERKHFDALVSAFPPFPGQSFKRSELAAKAQRQSQARADKARADADAKANCEAAVTGGLTVAGTVTGGVLGALGTFGLATPAGLAAGGSVGAGTGKFISGLWC